VINLYGILISFSILLCILVAESLAKEDKDFVWELSPWAIVSGLIGARIYHVISTFGYYSVNPIEVFYIWNGGLGIWGAIAGGLIGSLIYLRKRKKEVWTWLDICAVTLPLGQAIGRWGNFFNKEIYGAQTSLPWGININGIKYQPLFLYESILDILNFIILYLLYRKTALKNRNGFFSFLYLLNYSLVRFLMELLRQDGWRVYGLNVSLLIPILLFMTALYCLLRISRRRI
jgi:phosphatidylglycerol:prolipoprotein diacylglycerol transferase